MAIFSTLTASGRRKPAGGALASSETAISIATRSALISAMDNRSFNSAADDQSSCRRSMTTLVPGSLQVTRSNCQRADEPA